jgi:four helix bundle protein
LLEWVELEHCKLQNAKCKLPIERQVRIMGPEDLSERLLHFAARSGKVVDALPDSRMGRHVAGQLVRCSTSPAPNYEEACAAESRADFVHKLRIALKELRESRCWIHLIIKANLLPKKRLDQLLDESTQLCNIVGKSIVTTKSRMAKTR